MAYIVAKKIWKKEFSNGELELIWEIFKGLCSNVDWETTEYADYFRNNHFVYPETDIRDDTEGLKPKQMKKLLEVLDIEGTKFLLKTISDTGNKYRVAPFYEDGYISWKAVFKQNIEPLLETEDPLAEIGKFIMDELVSANMAPANIRYYNYSKEVYKAFMNKELNFKDFSAITTQKPYPKDKKLGLDDLTMKDFWEKRKNLWKETLGITPQVQELLLLEPKYWHKDIFLESLYYHYDVKQFSKLDSTQQTCFINLYKTFGPHIKFLNSFIKERKILVNNNVVSNTELYHLMEKPNEAFIKIVEDNKKGIEIGLNLSDFEEILVALSYFKDAKEDILKKDRIKIADIETLKEAAKLAKSIIKAGNENSLKHMNYKTMSVLNKYNLKEEQKKWALDLFEKTCHLKTKVPLFKETIGEYTVEMIDKDDIRGLVAGNATNCCQTLSGPKRTFQYGGSNCVYYGAEEKTSTFFIISKNNRIIAQSWVWMKDSQLTFDNIEVLGQEIRDSIADCYQAYADYVLSLPDSKIKLVTVGAGHSDLNLGKFWEKTDKGELIDEAYDARSGQYRIKKSK